MWEGCIGDPTQGAAAPTRDTGFIDLEILKNFQLKFWLSQVTSRRAGPGVVGGVGVVSVQTKPPSGTGASSTMDISLF